MSVEIKVPSIGESITEVTLASWVKATGDFVEEGETLCEIESDKATVELPAPVSGTLTIIFPWLSLTSPAKIRSKVVFPQPEGPIILRNSPSSISKSIPIRASTDPCDVW